MERQILLTLPDELYQRAKQLARQRKQKIEVALVNMLVIILWVACITPQKQGEFHSGFVNPEKLVYIFTGQVWRGQTFDKNLPQGFYFQLSPLEYAYVGWIGWQISISNKFYPDHDFASVATPPFRGMNALSIEGWHFRNKNNSAPNDGSLNAPQRVRPFHFVLNEENYQRASDLLKCILWPCTDLDILDAIEMHQTIPIASGELTITQLELGNLVVGELAWIEYMEFEVKLELSERSQN